MAVSLNVFKVNEPPFSEFTAERPSIDACKEVKLDINDDCIRVLEFDRSTYAGLGHQISELVFSAYLSGRFNAALKASRFDRDVVAVHHSDNYGFINEFLGIDRFVSNSDLDTAGLKQIDVTDLTNQECGILYKGHWQRCEEDTDCFQSFLMQLAFSKLAPCFRSESFLNGKWKSASPFLQSEFETEIVWHIRVGDREPHPVGDPFYRNLFRDLNAVLQANKTRVHFIAEWSILSTEKRHDYQKFLEEVMGHTWKMRFASLSLLETLAHMMHANLLIGSGSSLPTVAALFSDKPLYVNTAPKHGWHAQLEFVDGLMARDDGRLLNHVYEVHNMLRRKTGVYAR
jgi:hypothetical protein